MPLSFTDGEYGGNQDVHVYYSHPSNHNSSLATIQALAFEYDKIYTLQELANASDILIQHAKQGGFIFIGWPPISAWLNDESNIEPHSGRWSDTRLSAHRAQPIRMSELLDESQAVHALWIRTLGRKSEARITLKYKRCYRLRNL